MKKFLSIVLAVLLVVSIFPMGVFTLTVSAATSGPYISGYYTYVVTDGEVTITDCDTKISGNVTIPSTLGGRPVTNVGGNAFSGCASITSINIPSSVTYIGVEAFLNCTKLKSATIPDSVTIIELYAFKGCTELKSVTIGSGVTVIGTSAFSNCHKLEIVNFGATNCVSECPRIFEGCINLKNVNISDNVINIPSYAFENCTGLATIDIPESVTFIGDCAFKGCTNLVEINMSDSVTSIGKEVFQNTGYYINNSNWENNVLYVGKYLIDAKTSVNGTYSIKDDTLVISNYAFENCTGLATIDIPESVTFIGDCAFKGCTNLVAINIPNSLMYIGSSAFYDCTNLTSVNIPDSVKSIGDNAFKNCKSLIKFNITNVQAWCEIEFGNIYANPSYYTKNIHLNDTLIKDLIVPNGTTQINDYAFYNCSGLTKITIPDSVIRIGSCAFYNCNGFTSVIVPNSVTNIGISAFRGCSSLESITLPFVGSSRTANKTYDAVFGYIFGYSTIGFDPENPTEQQYTNYIYDTRKYYIPSSLKAVTITDATQIPYGAFHNCKSLVSVTIPKSLRIIWDKAFDGCTSLTDVWYLGGKPDKAEISIYSSPTNAVWRYCICEDDNHTFIKNGNLTCSVCGFSKTPAKPALVAKTNNSVTLAAIEGCEYSMDGENWQTSSVFSSVLNGTTHIFYQRVKETSTTFASEVSEGLSVVFKMQQASIPSSPIVSNFTDTTVALISVEGCEYSMDGINWQSSNVFAGLTPSTKYTFYQRYAENDIYESSNKSVGISVTTDKSKQALIPNAPTIQSYTASSITLNAVDGCEYSKNGTTWQSSNVFSGLSCGTEYTFYQRYKETATTYAGKRSVELIAKTDKGTQSTPSAPTLASKTYNSVTLTAISGYEYSRDGINWQTSNVFEKLEGETNYIFYQRKSETDTYYASNASSGLVVKTSEAPLCIYDPREHIYTNDCDTDCNICGQTRTTIHNYEWITDKQNNCGVDGIKHEECTVCHEKRNENTPIGATGQHSYSDNSDLTCETCGFVREPLYTPGDLDGVDGVTDRDAVYLLYHTFLPSLYPVNQDCNFNDDNEVNDKDAIYLLYHTFLPNLYPIG